MCIMWETRRLAMDLELLLLDASTTGHPEPLGLLGGAQEHVREMLGNLDKPPEGSRPSG